jgi:serine/threonine-protein kinase PknG
VFEKGDLVAGQYEVAGCLAHGGSGWVYLATDREVSDRWVVLKGLPDAGDHDATAAARAARQFLGEVDHPNIVKIFNFVEHENSGYIVMEYVGGESLKQTLQARRGANGGVADPFPPAWAGAYVLEVLPALGYLHGLGLVFCDFKPDHVIRNQHGLKLIDVDAVYRIGDLSTVIYGTVGYQAPEIASVGPSVSSDLFTAARTLAFLCFDFRGYQGTYRYTLPDPTTIPVLARHDSLYRFLLKGTATNPDDRFQSAEEMAEQLRGVLGEIIGEAPRLGVDRLKQLGAFGDLSEGEEPGEPESGHEQGGRGHGGRRPPGRGPGRHGKGGGGTGVREPRRPKPGGSGDAIELGPDDTEAPKPPP